jgi:hypothetical protein
MGAPAGRNAPLMLTMGDSVMWGQGLLEEHKFRSLVCDALSYRPEYLGLTQLPTLAHSGAIIGAELDTDPTIAPGEIPRTYPSLFQQCASYSGNSDDVRIILLDGGINDVSVGVIADPQTTIDGLRDLIEKYCHDAMVALLEAVTRKFAHPDCRVIVTGYYPIFSGASEYTPSVTFLELLGIVGASEILSSVAGFTDLAALSLEFRRHSDEQLARAVNEVAACGRSITFVPSGFTDADCLFQDSTLLWGFKGPPFDAADDFGDFRAARCSGYNADGSVSELRCRFASVGHPNASGAIRYYEQIMKAFA